MPLKPSVSNQASAGRISRGDETKPSRNALPDNWDGLWGNGPEDPLARKQLHRLRELSGELATQLPFVDRQDVLAGLVGSSDQRTEPIHRWFSYKEAFSPSLPGALLDILEARDGLIVADPFGGVATTALALQTDPRVSEIRSVEYSPLAHAIGQTKLAWPHLDPSRLEETCREVLRYRIKSSIGIPSLAAFSDPRIFDEVVVRSLVSARDAVLHYRSISDAERAFLLVGLAGVIEDSSGAMKDGRALRIRGNRTHKRTSLVPYYPPHSGGFRDPVKLLLQGQWQAMIEDLKALSPLRLTAEATPALHLRGDARRLAAIRLPETGESAFRAKTVDITLFSPPYLNFIDYTEVYKLELWLLGFVTDQAGFRRLRLGTLRSHPSVRFGERPGPAAADHPVVDLVHRLSGWVAEYGPRPEVGPIIRQYFEDMHAVFVEQARVLKPGGIVACVVANSTLSRRDKTGGTAKEIWRVPVLTDVLIAHLARLAGFSDVELWRARDLIPRNVKAGAARESVVVARL